MATKKQEREALQQIRDIVESLGKDSYIGMAFDGCFEMAEQNMDDDFALSPRETIEGLRKKVFNNLKEIESLKQACANRDVLLHEKDRKYVAVKEELAQAQADNEKAMDDMQDFADMLTEEKKRSSELEMEIIKLKAKLYDYMVNEGK